MKISNLLIGSLRSLSKGSVFMLLLTAPLSANESAPSLSFLEYLAEEENQSWMINILEENPEKTLEKKEEETQDDSE